MTAQSNRASVILFEFGLFDLNIKLSTNWLNSDNLFLFEVRVFGSNRTKAAKIGPTQTRQAHPRFSSTQNCTSKLQSFSNFKPLLRSWNSKHHQHQNRIKSTLEEFSYVMSSQSSPTSYPVLFVSFNQDNRYFQSARSVTINFLLHLIRSFVLFFIFRNSQVRFIHCAKYV